MREYHKNEGIMNNEENIKRQRSPNDHEEDTGDNGNDKHGEMVATFEFPIRWTIRVAHMNNISPLVFPNFMVILLKIWMSFSLNLTFSVKAMIIPPVNKS